MRGVCEDSPFPLVRPAWAIVKEHIVNNTHAPARFLLTPIFSNIPTLHHSRPGYSYYFAKIGTSSLPASVFMAFLFPYRLPWQTTNPQTFRLPHTHRYLNKRRNNNARTQKLLRSKSEREIKTKAYENKTTTRPTLCKGY